MHISNITVRGDLDATRFLLLQHFSQPTTHQAFDMIAFFPYSSETEDDIERGTERRNMNSVFQSRTTPNSLRKKWNHYAD